MYVSGHSHLVMKISSFPYHAFVIFFSAFKEYMSQFQNKFHGFIFLFFDIFSVKITKNYDTIS